MSISALPLSVIHVTGDDAMNFLQGQLTQDVASLKEHWNYAAQCNPQGRVIAFFIAFEWNNEFYLLMDKDTSEQTVAQLEKYVMRSKVTFSTLDDSVYYVATEGSPSSDESLKTVKRNNNSFILEQDHGSLHIGLTQPQDATTPNEWHQANIQKLVPALTKKALGEFTPESINLDLLGSVSFTKGCYTGQEIVARMHYLGKAKKRLFKVMLQGNLENIAVADKISDSEGKTIGHLVDFEKGGNALISIKATLNATLTRNKSCIQAVNGELML